MSTSQPRQPVGTPVGGQWTQAALAAAQVVLVDEVETSEGEMNEAPLPTFDVFAVRVGEARKRIEKANRRLAKAGIEGRFEATFEPYTAITKTPDGIATKVERCKITLNRPRIGYDGYTFAARVDMTESGKLMAMAAPGVELAGWQPESLECAHCGTSRQRKNAYVVQDRDGEYKVVGKSCLAAYTGIGPQGLWALEWDDLGELSREPVDLATAGTPAAPRDDVLAVAIAAAKVQGGYQNAYSDHPTSGLVRMVLWPGGRPTKVEEDLLAAVHAELENIDADAFADEVREALADNASDWARNVKTLLDEEWVTSKHTALLASSVAAVDRMRVKKREKATIAKGFVAPVGEKITCSKARVLKLRTHTSYFGYAERTTEMVRMQDENGYIITWWSSRVTDLEEGDEVQIDRATVKDHEVYNSEDQTVVTRAKLTVLSQQANGDAG